MENHLTLSVIPADICVNEECAHRQSLSAKIRKRLFTQHVCKLLSFGIYTLFFGACLSILLFGQGHVGEYGRDLNTAVALSNQGTRLASLELEVAELRENDRKQQEDIAVMHGLGIAVAGALGILQLVQLLAGKKIPIR